MQPLTRFRLVMILGICRFTGGNLLLQNVRIEEIGVGELENSAFTWTILHARVEGIGFLWRSRRYMRKRPPYFRRALRIGKDARPSVSLRFYL